MRHADRTAAWEVYNAEALVGLQCITPRSNELEAREVNGSLGDFDIAHVVASPHAVDRANRHILVGDVRAAVLYLTGRGTSTFHSGERTLVQRPGSAVLCSTAEPFSRRFPQGVDEVVIRFPRTFLTELGVDGRSTRLDTSAGSSGTVGDLATSRALARFARNLLTSASPLEGRDAAVQMRVRLEQVLSPAARKSAAGRRLAVLDFIDDHFHEADLTAGSVARSQGLTDRHIRRLFAGSALSLPETILQRRLDLARRMLSGEVAGPQSIAAIAEQCGFASHAHFARSFRSMFNERPIDVLRRSVA